MAWRKWGLPVVWHRDATPETVTAEVVTEQAPGLHVHFHLHLEPGMSTADVAALIQAASAHPQHRDAITGEPRPLCPAADRWPGRSGAR